MGSWKSSPASQSLKPSLPEEEEDTVFSYPYAFFREAIALMVTVTAIMAMSLFLQRAA